MEVYSSHWNKQCAKQVANKIVMIKTRDCEEEFDLIFDCANVLSLAIEKCDGELDYELDDYINILHGNVYSQNADKIIVSIAKNAKNMSNETLWDTCLLDVLNIDRKNHLPRFHNSVDAICQHVKHFDKMRFVTKIGNKLSKEARVYMGLIVLYHMRRNQNCKICLSRYRDLHDMLEAKDDESEKEDDSDESDDSGQDSDESMENRVKRIKYEPVDRFALSKLLLLYEDSNLFADPALIVSKVAHLLEHPQVVPLPYFIAVMHCAFWNCKVVKQKFNNFIRYATFATKERSFWASTMVYLVRNRCTLQEWNVLLDKSKIRIHVLRLLFGPSMYDAVPRELGDIRILFSMN